MLDAEAVDPKLPGGAPDRHLVLPVRAADRRCPFSAEIPQGDGLEQVRDGVPERVRGHRGQVTDQIAAGGIGRALQAIRRDEPRQRPVHRRLADQILERIQRERALVVLDVRLVLHQHQREFPPLFRAPAIEISVQLVPEELPGRDHAPLRFHQGEGRVVGQPFREPLGPADIGARHLLTPPLMPDLMGGNIEGQVDVVVARRRTEDESGALGERDQPGLAEGELPVPGELGDPEFLEGVRPEAPAVVPDGRLHRRHHCGRVEVVEGMTENLEPDPVLLAAEHSVASREDREVVGDRAGGGVLEDPAPALLVLLTSSPGATAI